MTLGERILQTRQNKKMSLRTLADKVGVTASHLSMVERNLSSPSIDTLRAIAVALDTPIFDFLTESDPEEIVVRHDKRRSIKLDHSPVEYQLLVPDLRGNIESFMVELDPGDYNLAKPTNIPTEEIIYVLQGKMYLQHREVDYHLESGDSIRINGLYLTKIQPIGNQKLIFISTVTPPFF